MKKATFFVLCLSLFSAQAQQDIHFSQFYGSPVLFNPATAGMFEGSVRFNAMYRSQWSSVTVPYTTMAATVDFPFMKGKFENGSFFGAGVTFYNDKAGDSKFTTGQYYANFNYALEVGSDEYFSAGLQGGVIQNSINYSALYYGNQWNGLEFDQSLANQEPAGASTSLTRADVSVGIYYFNSKNDDFAIFGGLSGYHLTAPNISLFNVTEKLFRKVIVHGGCSVKRGSFVIQPNTMLMFQGPNHHINLGSDFKFLLREQSQVTGFVDEISLALGTYIRFGDAFYTGLRFNYAGFTIGGVYDLNISSLSSASNHNGAYEFMLTYRAGFGTGKGSNTRFF